MHTRIRALFIIIAGAALAACGDISSGAFGATQGGVQDMTFARDAIAAGHVPPAESFVVEGMFSEHDLPIEGEPCETTLCVRAAMGIAPDADGTSSAWLQIGLSSTIDPETYRRPDVALVAAVDVSGSMGWGYGSSSPGALSKKLLRAIAAGLTENDRIAIVTYGSDVETVLSPTAGNSAKVGRAISDLEEGGITDMESGLKRAYRVARGLRDGGRDVRVMLFTDMQPNAGASTPSEFEQIALRGAADGIGLTAFGLGLGLGQGFLTAMSHMRGCNAFSLTSPTQVEAFMDDNWPWFVSPIAYDLGLQLTTPAHLAVADAFGFPNDGGETGLEIASVFLSKRRGAMLVQLTSEAEIATASADVDLQYETTGGSHLSESLTAAYQGEPLDERGIYMPQIGVAKTVALALLVTEMRAAAESYVVDPERAVQTLEAALERFEADASAIGDQALLAEAEFWPALLDLMRQGAEQGSFYGGF